MTRIDPFVEEQMDARRVPGFALAIVRGTRVVHQRGFGSANGSGRPATANTPFVLGSTTKSFTALAVMQLVDAGEVSLETPIARYVPELQLADRAERQVTVRHLLNQTSGIPGLAGGRLLRSVGDGAMEDVVAELKGTKLSAAPGSRFEYANANYVLLGLVIERSAGERYGDYIQRHATRRKRSGVPFRRATGRIRRENNAPTWQSACERAAALPRRRLRSLRPESKSRVPRDRAR